MKLCLRCGEEADGDTTDYCLCNNCFLMWSDGEDGMKEYCKENKPVEESWVDVPKGTLPILGEKRELS